MPSTTSLALVALAVTAAIDARDHCIRVVYDGTTVETYENESVDRSCA